ncbi:E3 ubiquitin-protein ligase MYCBP2 [Strongyloides ratti]|uniref:RCR-type E3 ubiquitin transferase n=1 Tax=Strongyloides ratti TaxID=34506 RepID=A0A090MUG1_STRRB|nr:E3 ubiquitin-protein ligase MYCBP2 [Strongyloides ratti]CEF62183.1 E3 ubiquitin-protein ligase MYCBP2 [Strongyloides ratti]
MEYFMANFDTKKRNVKKEKNNDRDVFDKLYKLLKKTSTFQETSINSNGEWNNNNNKYNNSNNTTPEYSILTSNEMYTKIFKNLVTTVKPSNFVANSMARNCISKADVLFDIDGDEFDEEHLMDNVNLISILDRNIVENFIRKQKVYKNGIFDSTIEDTDTGDSSSFRSFTKPSSNNLIFSGYQVIFSIILDLQDQNPHMCIKALQELKRQLECIPFRKLHYTNTGKFKNNNIFQMADTPSNEIEVMTHSMTTKLKILRLHYNKTIADLAQNCLLGLSIAYGSINMIFDIITSIIINERSTSERLVESGEFFKQQQIFCNDDYCRVPYNFYQFVLFIQKMSLSCGWNLDRYLDLWYEDTIDNHSLLCQFNIKFKSTLKKNENKLFSSITSDGTYLYILNNNGLFKIGTGFNETKRGHIYMSNVTIYGSENRNLYLFQKNKHEYLLIDNTLITSSDFNFHKTFLLIDKGTLQDLYHIVVKAPAISTKTTFKDHIYFVDNSKKENYDDSKLMFTCLDEKSNDLVIEELEINEMFEAIQKNSDNDEKYCYSKQRYQLVYYSFVKINSSSDGNDIKKIKIPKYLFQRNIKNYYEIKDSSNKEIIGKVLLTNCGNLWYYGDCQKFGLQNNGTEIDSEIDDDDDDENLDDDNENLSNERKWKRFTLSNFFIIDNDNEKIKYISYTHDIPDSMLLTLDNGKVLLLGKSIFTLPLIKGNEFINTPTKISSPNNFIPSLYVKEEILLDNDKNQKTSIPVRRIRFNYNKKKIVKAILKKEFCFFISETGMSYMIPLPKLGKNNCFIKTIPDSPEVASLENISVKDIVFGKSHGVVLDKHGKVWTLGFNDKFQCGRDGKNNDNNMTNFLFNDKILNLSPRNEEHSPVRISTKNIPINSLCRNDNHYFSPDDPPTICLICNKCSARGNRCSYAMTHSEVTYNKKSGIGLKKGDLCKCLTKSNGKVIGVCCRCGICKGCATNYSTYIRDAHKNPNETKKRKEIDDKINYEWALQLPINEIIIDIKAGDNHSIILTKDGSVYTFGSNDYGQLGIENIENERKEKKYFYKVSFGDKKVKIDQIIAGPNISIAKTDTGVLWFWGLIEKGCKNKNKLRIIKTKPTLLSDIINEIIDDDLKTKSDKILKNCSCSWLCMSNNSLILQLRKNLLQSNFCDTKSNNNQLKLNNCKIIADNDYYVIMPKKVTKNQVPKYILLNKKRQGTFTQYIPFNDNLLYPKTSISFDTINTDIIWCYDSIDMSIKCYKKYLLKLYHHQINDYEDKITKLNIHENILVSEALELLNLPEYIIPDNLSYITSINKLSDTQIGLIYLKSILSYTIISSLSHSTYENCYLKEDRSYDPENFKACIKNENNANIFPYPNLTRYVGSKVNDKNNFKIFKVSRFTSYSNGWSYYIPNALTAVEAISFKSNKIINLCGIGLFGGKGNYKANVRIYKLKGIKKIEEFGNDDEFAEILANEEVMYETGVQRFSSRREIDIYCVNLKKPIKLEREEWYTVVVNMTGEPGFCGKNGKEKVRIDSGTGKEEKNGDIIITFKNSLAANNGTDIKVGQVPELFIEIPKKDFHDNDYKGETNTILTSPALSTLNVVMAETIISTMTDEMYNLNTLITINTDGISNLLKIIECTIDTCFGFKNDLTIYDDNIESLTNSDDIKWNKERSISLCIMGIKMLTYCMKLRYPKEYFNYKTNGNLKHKYRYISNPLNIDFLYTEADADIIIRFYQLLTCILKQASKNISCNDKGIYSLAKQTSETFIFCGYLFFSIKEVIMGNLIKCIIRSDMNKKISVENFNYWKLYSLFKFIYDNKEDGHIDDLYSFMKFYEPNFCGNEFGRRSSGCNVFENTKFGYDLGQRLITSIDTIGYGNGTLLQREIDVTTDDFDKASKPVNIIKFLFGFAFEKNSNKRDDDENIGENYKKIRFKLKDITQKLLTCTFKKIIKSYSNMCQQQNIMASLCRFSKISGGKSWEYLNNINIKTGTSNTNGRKGSLTGIQERSVDAISFSINNSGVILYGFSIFTGSLIMEKKEDIICMFEAELIEINENESKENHKILDHVTGSVELLKSSKTQPWNGEATEDGVDAFQCHDIFFSKSILLSPNMVYTIKISFYFSIPLITAISLPNCCYITYFGENGTSTLQLINGTKITFFTSELCNNGTTVSRGQVPRILYTIREEQSRIVDRETTKEILRNLADIIIGNVVENTKNLIVNEKVIHENENQEIKSNDNRNDSKIMDLNFMINIINYSHIFSELDKRNTSIILMNLQSLIKIIGPILMEMKCKYYSFTNFPENKILLSNYCRLYNGTNICTIESDHPYKRGSFVAQFVKLHEKVDYMTLLFDPDCCSYSTNDKLSIFLVKDNLDEKDFTNINDVVVNGNLEKNFIKICTFSGRGKKFEKNSGNWPIEFITLPGKKLLFIFESVSSDGKNLLTNEEENTFCWGFKCTVTGYKNFVNENKYFGVWNEMNMIERLEILEKELVHIISDGCRLLMLNQNKKNLNHGMIGWCEENERGKNFYNFISKHENILKKGLFIDVKLHIKDIIEDGIIEDMDIDDIYDEEDDLLTRMGNGHTIERSFFNDFIEDKLFSKGSIFLRDILFESNENDEIGSDRYGNIMAHVDSFDNLLTEFIDLRTSEIEVHLLGKDEDDCDTNNGNLESIQEQVLVGQKIILRLILKDQHGKILRNVDNLKKCFIEIRESIGEIMTSNIQYSNVIPPYISNINNYDSFEECYEGRKRAQLFSLIAAHPYKPSIAMKSKYIAMTINPIFQDYSFEEIRWSYMTGMKKVTKEKYEFIYDNETNSRIVEWIPKKKGIYKILAYLEDKQFLINQNVSLNVEDVERLRIKGKKTILSFTTVTKEKSLKASWDYNPYNSGVRIRHAPSLQSYTIGVIVHTTRFNFIDIIDNKDGIWLKVNINEDGLKNFLFNKTEIGLPDKDWQYGYVLQYSKTLNVELIKREDLLLNERGKSPFEVEISHISNDIKELSTNINNFESKQDYGSNWNNKEEHIRSTKIIYNDKKILLTPFVFKSCRALFASYLWHTNKSKKIVNVIDRLTGGNNDNENDDFIHELKNLWKKIIKEVLKYLENQRYIMSSIESMRASIPDSDLLYHNNYKIYETPTKDLTTKNNGNTIALSLSPVGNPNVPPSALFKGTPVHVSSNMGHCELCSKYFDKPVTSHMKTSHPGCGAPSGGKGYNSAGNYTSGWSGSCGEGAPSNCAWYILCLKCRDKYMNTDVTVVNKNSFSYGTGAVEDISDKNSSDETDETFIEDKLEEDIIKKAIFLLKLNPYINENNNIKKNFHQTKVEDYDDEVFKTIDQSDPEILHSILKRKSSLRKKHYSGSDLIIGNQNTSAISDPGPSKFSINLIDDNIEDMKKDDIKKLKVNKNLNTNKEIYKRTARSQGNYQEYEDLGRESYSFFDTPNNSKIIDVRKIEHELFSFVFDNTPTVDLNLIKNHLKNCIKTSFLLSFTYQTFLNLIRIVSSEESIEDILFSHIETLTIFSNNMYNYISTRQKKSYSFFKNLKILPHPGKICLLSGEDLVKEVVEDFHNFIVSLSLIIKAEDEVKEVQDMTIIEIDKFRRLKNLCLKNWNFQYTRFDKDILKELCCIVKILGSIMSSGSPKEGKKMFLMKLKEIQDPSLSLWSSTGCGESEVNKFINITKKLKFDSSSNTEILNAIMEDNLETFWESSEDNKNKERYIEVEFGNLAILKHKEKSSNTSSNTIREVPEIVAVYIDNSIDDKNFYINEVVFKAYTFNLECCYEDNKVDGNCEFVVLKDIKLKKNFKGWVNCYLGKIRYDLKKIRVTLRSPNQLVRLRRLIILAGEDNVMERKIDYQERGEKNISKSFSFPDSTLEDTSSDEEQSSTNNTPKVESDAFILFKAITGQVFEENLNDSVDGGCCEDEKRYDDTKVVNVKDGNGTKLRNQILDYLFSKNHLEPIKGYVSVQITKALQKEISILKESKKKRIPKIKNEYDGIINKNQLNSKYKYALNLVSIIEKLCSHNFEDIYDGPEFKSHDLLTSIEKIPVEVKALKTDVLVLFSELLEVVSDDITTAKSVLDGIDKTIKMINISEKKNFVCEDVGRKVIKNMLNIVVNGAEVGVRVKGQRSMEMFGYEDGEVIVKGDNKPGFDGIQNDNSNENIDIEFIIKRWLEKVITNDVDGEYGNWPIFIKDEICYNIIEAINYCLGIKKSFNKEDKILLIDECYSDTNTNNLSSILLYNQNITNYIKLIEKPIFWMALTSLSLLTNKQWLDLSIFQNNISKSTYSKSPVEGIQDIKELPFCENHDDYETRASLICYDCDEMKLCKTCFKTLHLSKKKRGHSVLTLPSINLEDDTNNLDESQKCSNKVSVEVHEGSIRLKIENKFLLLVNNKRLKGILELHDIKNNVDNDIESNIHNENGIHRALNRLKLFDNPILYKICRFCEGPLQTEVEKLNGVCYQSECEKYKGNVCKKVHSNCGHFCNGIIGEKECLPCLKCPQIFIEFDNNIKGKINQDSDDLCSICYTDKLGSAPCIQVTCGHIFHYHCLMTVLENKWNGPRISFRFMKCPLCLSNLEHKDKESKFEKIMNDYRILYEDVKKKSLMRYKYYCNIGTPKQYLIDIEDQDNDDVLVEEALQKFMYCLCYKCGKAYYGGDVNCHQVLLQEDDGNQHKIIFKPEELICGGCSNVAGGGSCTKHGTEYIEYKCRFCCSVAVYFCFGTTHFCQICHSDFQRLMILKGDELPNCPVGPKATPIVIEGEIKDKKDVCPLKINHPDTGIEFSLGCGACRNIREF